MADILQQSGQPGNKGMQQNPQQQMQSNLGGAQPNQNQQMPGGTNPQQAATQEKGWKKWLVFLGLGILIVVAIVGVWYFTR
ncbi:MAG: hypothetical protein WDZ77_00925 [Candidatus Pacearchaeota archaeon]